MSDIQMSMPSSVPVVSALSKRKCLFCERRFFKTEHLKRHQRTHTGERPYHCSLCNKNFARSDVLGRHLKQHTTKATDTSEENRTLDERRDSFNENIEPGAIDTNNRIEDQIPSSSFSVLQLEVPVTDIAASILSTQPKTPNNDARNEVHEMHVQHDDIQGQFDGDDTEIDTAVIMNNGQTIRRTQTITNMGFENFDPLALEWERSHAMEPMDLQGYESEKQNYLSQRIGNNENQEVSLANDTLQSWFNDIDSTFTGPRGGYTPFDVPYTFDYNLAVSSMVPLRSENADDNYQIPNERFAKVEQCWPIRSPTVIRLMSTLWHDLILNTTGNLFSIHHQIGHASDGEQFKDGSRWGIDEECKVRFENEFGIMGKSSTYASSLSVDNVQLNGPIARASSVTSSSDHNGSHIYKFPRPEVFDIGLDLFFRHLYPMAPTIHLPTFEPKSTPTTMLFVMCLIGLHILNTEKSREFVRIFFPYTLDRLIQEVSSTAYSRKRAADQFTLLATTHLVSLLDTMMEETQYNAKCQVLYVNALTIAQQHGLFTQADCGELESSLFEQIESLNDRWRAWCRVESAKRVLTGLLMIDSWHAARVHGGPIVQTDNLKILVHCDSALFEAKSATKWDQVLKTGRELIMPAVVLSPDHWLLPDLVDNPEVFWINGLLSAIRLRISEAQYRLLSGKNGEASKQQFVPWQTYSRDKKAIFTVPLVVGLINKYNAILNGINPNCMMMWHSMCIMLGADVSIFELGAGRSGADRARKALEEISIWSSTPSARRACLHAAQTLKLMSNRRISDGTMFHAATTLFTSALVLGLYVYKVQKSSYIEEDAGGDCLELLDEVDWKRIGNTGLVPNEEVDGLIDDRFVLFIKNGGKISVSGVHNPHGYHAARRILLDYAGLLEDVGKWGLGSFSHVLRIMSDALMDFEDSAEEYH